MESPISCGDVSRGIAVDVPCRDDVQWFSSLDPHPASAISSSLDVYELGKYFLFSDSAEIQVPKVAKASQPFDVSPAGGFSQPALS